MIDEMTSMYIHDGGTVSLEQDHSIYVNHLLRATASATNPATITAHGPLADGAGNRISFWLTCVDYDPITGDGTYLQNVSISKFKSGESLYIQDCSPKFQNCKLSANSSAGNSTVNLYNTGTASGPVFNHCNFTKVLLNIINAHNTPGKNFSVTYNLFRESYCSINLNAQIISGQIINNNFDGNKSIELNTVTNVPLGGNYWTTYPPTLPMVSGGVVDFNSPAATLTSPPDDAGHPAGTVGW